MRKFSLPLMLLIVLLLSACSDNSTVITPDVGNSSYDMIAYDYVPASTVINGTNDMEFTLVPMDENTDLSILSPTPPPNLGNGKKKPPLPPDTSKGKKNPPPPDSGKVKNPPPPPDSGKVKNPPPPPDSGKVKNPTPPIPKKGIGVYVPSPSLPIQLKLTKEQKPLIEPIMKAYKICVDQALQELRASEKAIVENANALRKPIMEQIKTIRQDKTIPDADKKLQISELNKQLLALDKQTREELNNNPLLKPTQEAICNCFKAYLDAIRQTLTDEQKVVFDKWIATLKGPCSELGNVK